jgi:hypothetical protein
VARLDVCIHRGGDYVEWDESTKHSLAFSLFPAFWCSIIMDHLVPNPQSYHKENYFGYLVHGKDSLSLISFFWDVLIVSPRMGWTGSRGKFFLLVEKDLPLYNDILLTTPFGTGGSLQVIDVISQ